MNDGRDRPSAAKLSIPSTTVLPPTTQKIESTSPPIGPFQILYPIGHTVNDLQDVIKKYIRGENSTIDNSMKEYVEKKKASLFAVCNIAGRKDEFIRDHREHWIAFVILTANEKNVVFLKESLEGTEYSSHTTELRRQIEENLNMCSATEFVEHTAREKCTVHRSDIAVALNNLKTLVDSFESGNEDGFANVFREIKFSPPHRIPINFDRLIVETGLNNAFKFRLKPALQKILSALERVVEEDEGYKLENTELKKLIDTLDNISFAPREQDEVNLRDIIVDLIVVLKQRGQVLEESVQKKIKKYFNDNKDRYVKNVQEFDKALRQDSRNNQLTGYLALALTDLLKFVARKEKLIPEALTIAELDEVFKLLGNNNEQQDLEVRRIELENKLKITVEYDAIMEINYQLSDIRHDLDYYARKIEVSAMIDISDLVIVLGNKAEPSRSVTHEYVSKGTLDKVVEVGRATENKDVALAIVKIWNWIDLFKCKQAEEDIERLLDNILPRISQDRAKFILPISEKIAVDDHPSMLVFMYEILLHNEDKQTRNDALKVLLSCEFFPSDLKYIAQAMKLEEACSKNHESFLEHCLQQVKIGREITLNCFEKLESHFRENITSAIINEIVEHGIQKLPKSFVQAFVQCVNSNFDHQKDQARLISLMKPMLKGRYILFTQIQNFIANLIDDENVRDDIYDLLSIEVKNELPIPICIVDMLRPAAKTSDYAANLIKLTEKRYSDLDILKNSRESLVDRKKALEKVMAVDRNHTSQTVETLESLIKYDLELRMDCFQALVDMLPQDYTKKHISLDLVGILECIADDKDINLGMIRTLVRKDASVDLSHILTFIMHRIDTNRENALTFLGEISHLKENEALSDIQIQFLLGVVSESTDSDFRAMVMNMLEMIDERAGKSKIEIVKRSVDGKQIKCSLTKELKKLRDLEKLLINEHSLVKLKKAIEEEGYAVVEHHVKTLIKALDSAGEQELRAHTSDVLFSIDLTQGLTEVQSTAVFSTIEENLELLRVHSLLGIVAFGFVRNTSVPDKIVEALWLQLSEAIKGKTLNHTLICTINAFVSQKNQVPPEVLETMANFLLDRQDDIELRLAVVDIISIDIEQSTRYSEVSTKVIRALETVALQSEKSQDEYLLNMIVFQALKRSGEENDLSGDFLSKYYVILREQAVSLENYSPAELHPLDQYIATEPDAANKFRLMNVINRALLRKQKIDASIFVEFEQNAWRKELLCSELVGSILLETDVNEGVDEVELQNFRENLNAFSSFSDEWSLVEKILELLLVKQNNYQLNMEIINDILLMLRSGEECFEVLRQEDSNFYAHLREVWLQGKLSDFGIECPDDSLTVFNAYLPYRIKIINEILGRIKRETTIHQLIRFFDDLSNCGLKRSSIEAFLMNDIPRNRSVDSWQFILTDRLIGSLLSKKIPSYKDYLKQTKLEFDRSNFSQNAYNQAKTTYCYSAKDLAQILFEWMKDFGKSFRITQPLAQQEDRPLRDILLDIITEYKRDKTTTISLLNIAGNLWVTVALLNSNGRDIVLYKDSLGKDNQVNEREEVKNMLTAELETIDFKFHRSCEQSDSYNSGVFALVNMKTMAVQLRDKREVFLRNYDKHRFTSEKEALVHRTETFPKMYAWSLCRQAYCPRKIVEHHSGELESIRKLLSQNALLGNVSNLSIDLDQTENVAEDDYRYLYVFETSPEFDFSDSSDSKEKFFQVLEITEVYLAERNVLMISDENLRAIDQKEKLDFTHLRTTMHDSDIEELLSQLSVDLTAFSRDILKKNLGFTLEKYSASQSKEIVNIKDYTSITHLHKKLIKVAIAGWSMKSIRELLDCIDSEEKLKNLLNAIDPIFEYNLKEYDSNVQGNVLFDILKSSAVKNWRKEVHELAIFQTFKGSYDKSLETLKSEIYELNKENEISFLCNEKLTVAYDDVLNSYRNKSKLFGDCSAIEHWGTSEIKQWAEKVRLIPGSIPQHEKLAVVKRAVEITSKFPPRQIQLLSVLILTNPEENTGRLAQINTGEGKTTIVAMLAAIKALDGHKVDVVTSSPELARPQAEQQKCFFEQFGLTASHNGKDMRDIKERYQADIVYGAAGDFQGDILRDEYSKLGTRSGRICDVAIVDEVDSMLIDGKNHMVMLSSPMPAMDHLEPLLASIWIQIEEAAKLIVEIDGKAYVIDQGDMLDDEGKIKPDVINKAIPIEGTKETFIKKCTERHIRKLLRDKEHLAADERDIPAEYPEIKIPAHLKDLVTRTQLSKWIDSAVYAKYRSECGHHYIISKSGTIAPVDASNTGIVQPNMHWNNGLHQFLQIKHGAKISAESLSTNFISNVTYFKRYRAQIYGLTGTLGSISARELLKKTYSVDCVIIPPFRQKQYKELSPIITNSGTKDWYSSIVESCLNKLANGRGVLVITKFIKEVDELKNRLITEGYDASKIKVYKTEDDSKVIGENLKPGEIIIATNIAGRGTDIKAEKIERNGGLHVCITFLPPNERVEQQNVGRTSRTGNKGTSQFILLEKSEYDFEHLRRIRNQNEENELKEAEVKIKKVTITDAIFAEFCKLLNEINAQNDSIMKIKVRAVEERFGIWLKMQEDTISRSLNEKQILGDFERFKMQILDEKTQDKLIQNPYFHVLIGNELLNQMRRLSAIEEFGRAIALDGCFQANAYYNRGYTRIAHYGSNVKKYGSEIRAAIADLQEAKRIIEENLEPMLHIIQKASSSEALSEQVDHKMTLYGIQKNVIEMAIGVDVGKEIKALESQKDSQGTNADAINQHIANLKETKAVREKGVIRPALETGYELEIELLGIEKSLPEDQDITNYKEEIEEYKNNGFIGSFRVKEVKPIDWSSVIALTALGLAQIVGGAALAVFTLGAGASIGMGLLSEGISDLITAVKDGIINRDFSWVSYGIQKAISLTVSLVCAGLGAIKDAAKTAVAGVKSIGSVVTTTLTTTVKKGWTIAAKAIGTNLAKGVAREVVTQLVDYGVSKALMPSIQDAVMKRVEGPIQQALLNNSNVKKMLELDGFNRNKFYQNLIQQKAMEILNPQNDPDHALLKVIKGIGKGIATTKVSGLSSVLQIGEAMLALDELVTFVPTFVERLNVAIEKMSKEQNVDVKLEKIEKQQNVHTEHQKVEERHEKQEDVRISSPSITTSDHTEDIDLEKSQRSEEQVTLAREAKTPLELNGYLASSLSVAMCNIIQNRLIAPVTHTGVNFGMSKLTAGLDKSINDQIGDYQAERRIEFLQDNDKDNRIPEEFKSGAKDEGALAKADSMIDDLKNGGEAGLPHLGPLSEETGRPIKVLDEQGRVIRIIGEDKGGPPIEVEYHKPTTDNPQGHWTLPGGVEPAANATGKNNCLFNVISQQTGIDPNQLRSKTVTRMNDNKENLAKQASDITRLEQYKRNALTMGGVRLQGQTVYLDDDDIDAVVNSVNAEYNRQEPPDDFKAIDAYDENGNKIEMSRHHMIPEQDIRAGFTELVQKYSGDKSKLKTELNTYLNHPNNLLGKEAFIKSVGLDAKNPTSDNSSLVARSVLKAVSWHPNNLRLGPNGSLRSDDPEKLKNKSKIDYAVADPKSRRVLDEFDKTRGRPGALTILETQNRLPNNVKQYGWKEKRAGEYQVDRTKTLGKLSRFLKVKTGDSAKFNPLSPRGDRKFES